VTAPRRRGERTGAAPRRLADASARAARWCPVTEQQAAIKRMLRLSLALQLPTGMRPPNARLVHIQTNFVCLFHHVPRREEDRDAAGLFAHE